MNTDYTPIACSFHDRLESWAIRRESVEVVWHDMGVDLVVTAVIEDVFAKDGADWVRLATGETVRTDRLVSVGGVPLAKDC